MAKEIMTIDTIKLSDTKYGTITVVNIEEPYGPKFPLDRVLSIGITMNTKKEDKPTYKVDIPYSEVDAVIAALKKAKETYDK